MPIVSEQVTESIKSSFSSRLDHTGFKPPVNLQSKKGQQICDHSYYEISQIVNLYVPWPVVKNHDGPGVT